MAGIHMSPVVDEKFRAVCPELQYPPVMVSEARTTPRSRGPQHARFSHAGVVAAGERGQVEPSRQCILCHAASGSSTEDPSLWVSSAVKKEWSAVEPALSAVEECGTGL